MIDVSVVILNYKSARLVKEQLRYFFSLPKQSVSYEVIVVDNDSREGAREALAGFIPRITLIESPSNRGYAAGNNLGIAKATGRYILIVNPDIVISPDVIEGLYSFMESHPKAGIAGPKLTNADGSLQYSCLHFPDAWLPLYRRTAFAKTRVGSAWLRRYFMQDWDHASERAVDWLFGACLMVRADAMKQVGLLDERFFLYMEDTDWCRRFWESGNEVWYVPSVAAVHLHGRLSEGSPLSVITNKGARIHLKSFVLYLMKYRGKENPHTKASVS